MLKFALITLFISAQALACPNLAGNYASCKIVGGEEILTDMVVTQSVQNRYMTYEVNGISTETNEREFETYRADGKKYSETITDPDTGMVIETSSLVYCTKTALVLKLDVKLDNEVSASTSMNIYKVGKQLIVDSTSFDGEETTTLKEICE